jgi:hypothetical protein
MEEIKKPERKRKAEERKENDIIKERKRIG